jgi:predicted MFS family arabinose efflux permease
MYTAVGVGAIAASLLVARVSHSPHKQQILSASGVGFGLSLAAFAMSGSYLVALVLLAVVGFASQVFLTLNKTLLMVASDRAYYGRVMSIYMMGFSLSPMALLPLGAAVDIVGAPTTIAAAGVAIIAAVALSSAVQGIRKRGAEAILVPTR